MNTDKKVSIGCALILSFILTSCICIVVFLIFSSYIPKYRFLTVLVWIIVFCVISYLLFKEDEKNARLAKKMERDLNEFAAQTGKNAHVEVDAFTSKICFDIDSTTFEIILFAGMSLGDSTQANTIRFRFPVPHTKEEKFYLEKRGTFFPNQKALLSNTEGCERISFPPLDEKFYLDAANRDFLLNVLSDRQLIEELAKTAVEKTQSLRIYLENGEFFADCEFWTNKARESYDPESLAMIRIMTVHSLNFYRRFRGLALIKDF